MSETAMPEPAIFTIDEISALMYVRHISVRCMAKMLGINSSRMHAMLKYKDEKHNRLLKIACTYILRNMNDPLEFPGDLLIREVFQPDANDELYQPSASDLAEYEEAVAKQRAHWLEELKKRNE